jgi:hypothetical protein
MDLESIGASGAMGFITSILSLLGYDRRVKRVEEGKVDVELCQERHDSTKNSIIQINVNMEKMKDRVDKIYEMLLKERKI